MKYFTPTEDNYLRQNYKVQSIIQLGDNLGRAYSSINHRLNKLGLILSDEAKYNRRFKRGTSHHRAKHINIPYMIIRGKEKIWCIGENKRYIKYLCEEYGLVIQKHQVACLIQGFDHSRPPTIADIEIITKKEQIERVAIWKYPKEIQQAYKSISWLTRTIIKLQK